MGRALAALLAVLVGLPAGGRAAAAAAETAATEAPYHFALAKLLAEEGAFREAIVEFDQAVALAPDDVFLRLEFANLLLRLGRLRRAGEQVDAARRMAPDNLDVLKVYSRVHLKLAEQESDSLPAAREALEALRLRVPDDLDSMMSLGQIYLSESRPAEAAEVFRQVLSRRPGNRVVYALLVDALLGSGQASEAEQVLREALAADPRFTRARIGLAEMLSERGDHGAAAELLRDAQGGGIEIRRRLALELYQAGELEEALTVLDEVLAEQPDYFGGLYLRALVLGSAGRHAEAEEETRRLLDQRPDSLELNFLLARMLEEQGDLAGGARTLAALAERAAARGHAEQAAKARRQLALLQARGGRWDEVVEVLRPLVEEPPPEERPAEEHQELLLLYADALAEEEREPEAIEILAGLEPGTPAGRRALARRAELLFELQRDGEGEALLADLAGGGIDDLLLVAEVYQRLERYGPAIPVLERALAAESDSVQALFWLGAAYERVGRKEDAATVLERLLANQPEFAPALNYLGYMWAEEGRNLERALALVQQAVALEPDNGAYVDSLGWAHFQLGHYEEARTHLQRAADLVGDDSVVLEHLGDVYRALGEMDEARSAYQRALTLEGDNADQVRQKLQGLGESR